MRPLLRPLRLDVRGSTFLTVPVAKRVRFSQLTPWSLYEAPFVRITAFVLAPG